MNCHAINKLMITMEHWSHRWHIQYGWTIPKSNIKWER